MNANLLRLAVATAIPLSAGAASAQGIEICIRAEMGSWRIDLIIGESKWHLGE